MKFNMPMAVFGGLALIAAAIYFGSGSAPVNAAGGLQKVQICSVDPYLGEETCARVSLARYLFVHGKKSNY